MGRRSINTTKSGKYMNPTDQARKEARKKELKKNKKQRQMVRAAVLKGKDPMQLIAEMEKIDNMEYNVLQPSPLNEKVLKDKRRKLRETLDRVLKMYLKEDPEKWEELKRAESEYEKRRLTMATYSEAVRHAQQVQVDEIPLPISQLGSEGMAALGLTSQIPLPEMPLGLLMPPPPSILRTRSAYSPPRNKNPPGVPPGPPPELSSDEETDGLEEKVLRPRTVRFADGKRDDDEDDDYNSNDSDDEDVDNKKSNSAVATPALLLGLHHHQQAAAAAAALAKLVQPPGTGAISPAASAAVAAVAAAASDMDSFMREMEKKREEGNKPPVDNIPLPVPAPSGQIPVGLPPAPPVAGSGGLMVGMRPPGPPPGLPPRLMAVRLPPGPPPGLPPRMLPPRLPSLGPGATPNVVTAAPQLIAPVGAVHQRKDTLSHHKGPTIEAKAQIRNLSGGVTRFVPTALRVKRNEEQKGASGHQKGIPLSAKIDSIPKMDLPSKPSAQSTTKDDAYSQFMREMEGLL